MIKNTYELSMQPTARAVLDSMGSSFWLKKAVQELLTKHDPLDALRDVEVLHAILKKRFDDLTV